MIRYLCCALLMMLVQNNLMAQNMNDTIALEETVVSIDEEIPEEEWEKEQLRIKERMKHPLDINQCSQDALEELGMIDPGLAAAIIKHREMMGDIIDLYELQAVIGMNYQTFCRLKLVLTVKANGMINTRNGFRWSDVKQEIEFRTGVGIERNNVSGNWKWMSEKNWEGGAFRHSLRYSAECGKRIKLVLKGEKDAGELFRIGGMRLGYDYWGGGVMLSQSNRIHSLVIGDYLMQWGQGLIQWQGRQPTKGADLTSIKAQSNSIRLHTGFAEHGFYRGIAFKVKKKAFDYEGFVSFRKLDARTEKNQDSVIRGESIIGLQETGLHRTSTELAQKGLINAYTIGARVCYKKPDFHVAAQMVNDQFDRNWSLADDAYAIFRKPKKNQFAFSLDYAATIKQLHFFGEVGLSNAGTIASVNGLILSVGKNLSLSLLYRNYPNGFLGMHGQPFGVFYQKQSESGMYSGIQFKINHLTQMHFYTDVYQFSWLKYRLNALTGGKEMAMGLQQTRRKGLNFSVVAKYQAMEIPSDDANAQGVKGPIKTHRYRFQSQAVWPITAQLTSKLNVGYLLMKNENLGGVSNSGLLINWEAGLGLMDLPIKVNTQLIWANTSDYESRLYTPSWSLSGYRAFLPFYGSVLSLSLGIKYHTRNGFNSEIKWFRHQTSNNNYGTQSVNSENNKVMQTFYLTIGYSR